MDTRMNACEKRKQTSLKVLPSAGRTTGSQRVRSGFGTDSDPGPLAWMLLLLRCQFVHFGNLRYRLHDRRSTFARPGQIL